MVRAGPGLAALLLAGCAQLLGLEEPQPAGSGSGYGTGSGRDGGVSSGKDGGVITGGDGGTTASVCTGVVYAGTCYELQSGAISFGAAISRCESLNGTLAKVDSPAVESMVGDMVAPGEEVYLGANDQNQPGTFRWLDGSPLSFTAWLPSQPDKVGIEHCLALQNTGQIGWEDVGCGVTLDYLCARPF